MTGGVHNQALTDIAGKVVGGGGMLCDIANTQDESLVQFYSEALAFAFFAPGDKMLAVPWTLLGARRYMKVVTGESTTGFPWFGSCGKISSMNWLNENVTNVQKTMVTLSGPYAGAAVAVASSAFVAVKSRCASCRNTCRMEQLVNNVCPAQRTTLDSDIALWYQAYSPTMYHPSVQGAFRAIVQSIGTGPWGAGAWYGDSQQYFLTVWLATSLLGGTVLDYYIYDHFCENPGNQCFLLGAAGCTSCIQMAHIVGTPLSANYCGHKSVLDIVKQLKSHSAQELYFALKGVGPPPTPVFDLIR